MASEEVEVSTSQRKTKKRGGQFCVAGGPYGTRCTNSTYSHGVSMHTFPASVTDHKGKQSYHYSWRVLYTLSGQKLIIMNRTNFKYYAQAAEFPLWYAITGAIINGP